MQTSQIHPSSAPTKLISCPRSGLPLATVTAVCSNGWPLLSSFQANLFHPIYGMPIEKLILKLTGELNTAQDLEWCITDREEVEMRLSISAIMYALDAIWQPPVEAVHLWKQLEPSLPSWPVTIGTGARVVKLASWWHYATSKRISFPIYRISSKNDNLNWENFSLGLMKPSSSRRNGRLAKTKQPMKRSFARELLHC